jgi:hypothetical protein
MSRDRFANEHREACEQFLEAIKKQLGADKALYAWPTSGSPMLCTEH